MKQIITPSQRISGEIRLPGDKSISHRALMIGAISGGVTEIENLSNGADVQNTIKCLQNLGVKIGKKKRLTRVHGQGLFGLREYKRTLDVGNSGTTIRLLSGILAGQSFDSVISGDASIQRRPMSRIVQPLRKMGANIQAREDEFPPLRINHAKLQPICYDLPVASAQVKSCLLFAGLYANGKTEIVQTYASRDHSELMLRNFGAEIETDGRKLSITGPAKLEAQTVSVPGDLSSAAFFLAAGTVVKEGGLLIEKVGINPTRSAFLKVLNRMGADVQILNVVSIANELRADLFVEQANLKGVQITGSMIPNLIDEIPILAVLATQAQGTTEILEAAELRKKESDRIHSLAINLKRMGAEVRELEDGLIINGPTRLKGAELESFGDHRIAMAFAVAALIADRESRMKDAECVEISFPGFFEQLRAITHD